ncbi:MAG: Hsp20/alpha crystallin family protein [Deltaproteobacteria bacterium]|nr:Hsp20/alpha crystallin family protein [Deltaproteobacteria bacterium]
MLTLWNPTTSLFRWSPIFDELFAGGTEDGREQLFAPAVDIEEQEDKFVLRADLPGVSEKDIEVRVHEGTLALSGKREEAKEEKREGGYYRERRSGSFHREFRLGPSVDGEKIAASYKNGVLSVVLPKKEEVKPRQIPVSAS